MKAIHSLIMILILVWAKIALTQDLVTQAILYGTFASANICANKEKDFHYVTALDIYDRDLDGLYYGVIRDNHRSYTIKISFKDNYFDYIDITNNNVIPAFKYGYYGPDEILRLVKASCADLYSDKKDCHKDRIFSVRPVNNEDIKNLCIINPVSPYIRKTKYIGRIFGNYMLANGFNTDFINRIINYQEKKRVGTQFCRIKGFGFDDCVPDD